MCMSCQMFDQYITTGVIGDLTDIYEIDASKSGKNDVNSMLESMEYPAMSGNWKVYIMDEAHLLSDSAMGSLLKSLEEPPEGVFIMLCTTNPEKLTCRNSKDTASVLAEPLVASTVSRLFNESLTTLSEIPEIILKPSISYSLPSLTQTLLKNFTISLVPGFWMPNFI